MQPENLTSKIVIATLKSWRFISGISALTGLMATAIFITTSTNHIIYVMLLFSALLSQYYCWRTWLDCHYFHILNLYPEKSADFDQALLLIFNQSPRSQTINERFKGAIRLLKRAVLSLILQLGLFVLFILIR
ncbi:hypothetical protein ID856_09155 [Xenorhabdus sp. 18]|uniref:hypothetical protein n=1 Tax=Xenorhabdus doucetiae TaxID=351671 RepID=UPI0019CD12BD|nr:hypothetical protein [Xenorhabdus sp. 18]MBD2796698.1 hypothetical protein [Xenorhabdus sp. 18]